MKRTLGLLGLLAACQGEHKSAAQQSAPSASQFIAPIVASCTDAGACAAACDAGSAEQCRLLGNSYTQGSGVAKDEAQATALLTRACDLQDPTGCVGAGRLYESGRGVEKDEARAAQLYDRACGMGDGTGCYNSAIMLEKGRGVPKDEARAVLVYDRVCQQGSSSACAAASRLRSSTLLDSGAIITPMGEKP